MSISSRRAGGQSARASFVARFARVVVALSLSFLSVPLLTQASYAEGDAPIVATETTADPPAAEDPPAPAPAEEPAAEEPAQEPAAEEPAAEEPAAEPAAEEPAAEEPAAEEPAAEEPSSDGAAKGTGSSPTSTGKLSAQLALPDPDCSVTDFNQNTQENSGGSWINGALNQNNSNYAEGDYVPQRVLLNGLVPGTYTIGFSYDVTKNGKYAYDFVDDLAITGSAGASVSWDAFEGPAPVSNPPVGTQTEFVTITFTIVAAGDDTATISWAGHIASEIDYGPNSSAGSISGAPYHFSLISTTGTWGCDAGNRDNQLMADAVDFATITIIKDAVPNSSQDFSFSASTPNGNTTFDLDDDADGTLSNTWTRHVAPGVTTVTEGVTPGWDLTDLTCTGSTAGVESGTGVALTLADDDTVTCTFTNSHESSIEVDKYWIINGGTPVLEGSEPGHLGLSAQLMIDQANKNWDTIYGGYLEGATANLAESVTFGNGLCTWASADATQHGRLTEENTVAVNLELPRNVVLAGGDNHYTITNRVTCNSTLTLQKTVQNGDALASAWTLSATPTNGGMAYASGSTGVTHTVTADSAYTLGENAADPRYQQVGPWSCTQYGHVTNGSVSVDAGRTATCTVTNATAELILKKLVQNPNGGAAVPANFTLVADPVGPGANLTTPGDAAGVSFFVNPGETFNLSETGGPDGYTLSGINCGNGSVTSVQVPVSTTVTCTFTNVDSPGVLTLNKHVVSDSGDGAVATDWTLSATPVGIANQPVISGDGTATGATKAGTYQLAEDGLAGYAASAWDCNDATTDADVPVNADDQIAVGANQEVVCDITNRAIAPTLTLVKSVKDPQNTGDETGPGAFTLTATPDGIAGQGALSGPGGASDTVKVGTYTLSEVGPATYAADPAGWSCVDDDGAVPVTGSQVTVGLDQDVVCTIINNAIPSSYMLEKTSDPASGATVLPNTPINYTVTLTKVGNGVPVENFDVTDTLTGVEDGWVTGLADDGATILNGVITWHIDELGDTPLTLTYTVTVGPDAWDSVIENQVTPGPTPCVNDGDVDCDFTEHFTPHYTLDKAVKLLSSPGDDDGLAEPGEQLEYSLTVLNDTEDAFVNTTVTDDLSNVLSNAQMVTSDADLLAQGLSLTGDQLTWTINDLAPGDDLTVTYVVQINDHAWHVSLDNIATPGPLSGGECIPAGDVPGDGVDDTTECETSTPTPDVTTMVVEKRDVETDEVLPGATFELFVDANNELSEGGDCTFASPPVVDDADQSLGTSETDADGQALFHELQHGCYLLVETIPPEGYSLPEVHVMGIQIDEDNFVGDDGEMAAIVVTDFGEGHLAIVAKRQFEEINGTWVESDGKVGFGDHVRYVVRVEATGPKNFHDVKVTDFIPGFSPEDTTSTVKATLVEGTAVCENGLDCTTSVSADNEVTWDIGDVEPANGQTIAGDAVMEVVFPDRPANLQLDPGETYEATLWNVGYLQWTELTSPSTPATRIAHAAGRAGLLGTAVADLPTTTITLRSNEVVVSALFKAPAGITHGPGPGPIPQTGAPAGMAQLALFGLALIAGGLVLMRRTRKE